MNREAYRASYVALIRNQTFYPPSYIKSLYAFCNYNCKVFSVSSYDMSPDNKQMNGFYFLLPTGVCGVSTYLPSQTAWLSLLDYHITIVFQILIIKETSFLKIFEK